VSVMLLYSDMAAVWNGLGMAGQTFVVAGALLVVVFVTFILLCLQDAIERLFQGSWPPIGPLPLLVKWLTVRQETVHIGLRRLYEEKNQLLGLMTHCETNLRDLNSTPPTENEATLTANEATPADDADSPWKRTSTALRELQKK